MIDNQDLIKRQINNLITGEYTKRNLIELLAMLENYENNPNGILCRNIQCINCFALSEKKCAISDSEKYNTIIGIIKERLCLN